jgi:hypothetical protein
MGRHASRPRHTALWVAGGALAGIVVVSTAATALPRALGQGDRTESATTTSSCVTQTTVRVTTASSFTGVLRAVGPALQTGPDCVRLQVTAVDGRAAATRLTDLAADVWIPDDGVWATYASPGALAAARDAGGRTVVATSPVYMVTDSATAARVRQAGGSWLGLSGLLADDAGVRLAVREPVGSGEGIVGAGALGEAVWLRDGMDASSIAMVRTLRNTRTAPGSTAALPARTGEVGLVAEYALLPRLPSLPRDTAVLSGSDRTALLRYTWFPTASGVAVPQRRAALDRVLAVLSGPEGIKALAAAGLRQPAAAPPPGVPLGRLPALARRSFAVMEAHHADHILATWYPAERRANLLLVVDISGSMAEPAPGSRASKIRLVREGVRTVAGLLPSDSRLGVWVFGFDLDGRRDYRVLVPVAPLGDTQRAAVSRAVRGLEAIKSGTALYDTILDAYRSAQAAYTPGVPNQVLFFTDGHDQDAPNGISAAELNRQLRAVADPRRPVEVAMVVFGKESDTSYLKTVLAPVKGYLTPVTSGQQVAGMFVHVAVGGLRTR